MLIKRKATRYLNLRYSSFAAVCLSLPVTPAMVLRAQANLPEQVLGTDTHAGQGQAQTPSTATSVETNAAPEYLLKAGDTVSVSYRFTPEYDDTATVGPDGRLTLRNLGSLPVAGATLQEVKARVLQAAYTQLVNPEITIALRTAQHARVVVSGQVRQPGSFELRQPTTVLQAILLAGGPGKHSHMGHVLLFRNRAGASPETHVLNLKHLQREHIPDDILLQPDDMVLVQR